jgi:hypothetical protein
MSTPFGSIISRNSSMVGFSMFMGTRDGVVSASICVDVSPKGVKNVHDQGLLLTVLFVFVHAVLQLQHVSSPDFPSLSYHPPHLVGVIPPTYEIDQDVAQSVSLHYILQTFNSSLVVIVYIQ